MKAFAGLIHLGRRDTLESFARGVGSHPYCRGVRLSELRGEHCVMVAGADRNVIAPFAEEIEGDVAVGTVRLDNREEVARRLGWPGKDQSDLALAVRLVREQGLDSVDSLIGDFAFVYWSDRTRTAVAVRDAVGVRPLYVRVGGPHQLMFASRAELLADVDRYDLQYLAEAIACAPGDPGRTAFAGVQTVRAGHVLTWRAGVLHDSTYWEPHAVLSHDARLGTEEEQCGQFRSLLLEAVRTRVTPGGRTWAHLSGGMDSSSVASAAEWLARVEGTDRLGGTITFVDRLGTPADERAYSDAVVRHYGLRNEHVPHQIDHAQLMTWLPRIDHPLGLNYSVALRDRQVGEIVRRAGGTVVLTGLGGDNLVLGTMFFFADWCATGRVRDAIREMAHRAALGRVSFWELAFQNAVMPVLPSGLRGLVLNRTESIVPSWLTDTVRRRYRLSGRPSLNGYYAGRPGSKFAYAHAEDFANVTVMLQDGVLGDVVDVRHPFLHRPLVEFALRLAPEMIVRPHAHKWILREAMRGILPDVVRMRVGKGDGNGLNAWALQHNARMTDALVRGSLLADLGLIEPRALLAAIDRAGNADTKPIVNGKIQRTLDLELWLRVQSGRWTSAPSRVRTTAAG